MLTRNYINSQTSEYQEQLKSLDNQLTIFNQNLIDKEKELNKLREEKTTLEQTVVKTSNLQGKFYE